MYPSQGVRGSSIRAREVGRSLRDAMKYRGWNGHEMALKLGWSDSKVSRILSGHIVASQIDVASFLLLCDVAKDRLKETLALLDRVESDLLGIPRHDFWDAYLAYAGQASEILEFQTHVVPWMAQVPDYTNSLVSSAISARVSTDPDLLFEARRQAVQLLRRPTVSLLLHESALRAPVVGAAMMAEQLDHLLLVSGFPEVSIHVIPRDVSVQDVGSGFTTMAFSDSDPIVCREDFATGFLLSDKTTVERYRVAFRRMVGERALDEAHSRELIGSVAAEFAAVAVGADHRGHPSLPTMR